MNFQRANTKVSLLEDFYNHFDEDHRLKTRHGKIEFITTFKYLEEILKKYDHPKILDLGAGTGAYSIPLAKSGYDVTAFELVPHNLEQIKNKNLNINCILGNAIDLSCFNDQTFDIILVFGPIYHLIKEEEKIKCLQEVKRVLKNTGTILISYYMNDYAVITYGFKKGKILESINNQQIDQNNYHVLGIDGDLYSFVTLEDINNFNQKLGFNRKKIIAQDGASNYLRVELNKLSEEEYQEYVKYHLNTCERSDLLGASTHLLDIVKKQN